MEMEARARRPLPEALALADFLEHALQQYIKIVPRQLPEWEAPIEALAWTFGMVRNVEAVVLAVRSNQGLLPAVWANARAVFEPGVRAVWMLAPADRMQAECRWLGVLAEYARYHEQMLGKPGVEGSEAAQHRANYEAINSFRLEVISRLPRGLAPVSPPSVQKILEGLGTPEMYRLYRESSQYLHGTMAGAAIYRDGLGMSLQLYDRIRSIDWIAPLRLTWVTFHQAALFVLDRLDGDSVISEWCALKAPADEAFLVFAESAVGAKEAETIRPPAV